ncbi:MAG: cation:proton antiporter [Verrucomicrobiota bacterium]|nr:cation:proton antiporter [Verrucomicrobiota bacterium]
MHGIGFLQDLAVVMIVAGLVTIICHRFRQPVVLGYILAGVIIGPHTPPFPLIQEMEAIHTLAELGVVFLMFSLGLEFSLKKLQRVGMTALIGATLEILLMFFLGYQIGLLFGWNRMDSIFLGAMLSISSTTIIVKALAELGKSKEPFANLIFGILVVEDILAIVMIALLSGIAMTGTLNSGQVAETVGRLLVFLATTLVVGLITLPRLIRYVARFKSNEMLLITVLGLCFGVSLLAVKLGYSVALGAFLIGAIIAESRDIGKIEGLMEPVQHLFSAVFFVAIGLLIQPKLLLEYAVPIVVITVTVIVGKVFTCALGTFVAGHDTRTSLKVGMGLAQIGEFSFIIASLGLSLKVTSEFLYPIAVTVSAITTLFTPYLIRSADALVNLFDRKAPRALVKNMEIYTHWVGQLGGDKRQDFAARLIKKWLFQILLNVTLMSGILITAGYFAQRPPAWLPKFFHGEGNRTILWLTAAVLTLPFFIANYRKLQALGMLLADLKITRTIETSRKAAVQAIIAQVVALTGTIGMALLALLLSSALLPPVKILIALLFVLGLVAWILWRNFVKLYSKAQVALQETLAEKPAHVQEPPLPSILREAKLETLHVEPGALVAGKLIREVQLRTRTGASVVGIQRPTSNIINPGPDEELLAGDEVLLLGREEQLESARPLFQLSSARSA